MKRIIFILILSISAVFLPKLCSAAIDADTVWELRADATASNSNGGGFNSTNAAPGTDYSQQTAAEDSGTDLASADGDANPCVVTSATHNFVAADNGNIINITAGTGWTRGRYEIVSTASNAATLDRACGSDGAISGGTWYLGGAISLGATSDDDFFDQLVAGNTVWIKNGSYSLGEATNTGANGTVNSINKFTGYNNTRGDNPTGSNRPTINVLNYGFGLNDFWHVSNIIVTGISGTTFSVDYWGKVTNSKFINSSTTANRNAIGNSNPSNVFFDCEAVSYRGRAFNLANTGGTLINCYAHDSDIGVNITASSNAKVIGCIIESNVTSAIAMVSNSALATIYGNTLYGAENTTGTGISIAANSGMTLILNNIIYGFATGISHATATDNSTYANYNDFFNNDTDVSNVTKGANDQALAPSFTSVAQVTGTTGKFAAGGNKLIDTSKNFVTSGVTAGQDVVYIVSGTGVTAGQYLIDSISTTTNPNDTLNITIPASPGTNTTADKVYQITTGRNFGIGTALKGLGFPGGFQAGLSTGYMDIGAVQRPEPAGGGIRGRIKIR